MAARTDERTFHAARWHLAQRLVSAFDLADTFGPLRDALTRVDWD